VVPRDLLAGISPCSPTTAKSDARVAIGPSSTTFRSRTATFNSDESLQAFDRGAQERKLEEFLARQVVRRSSGAHRAYGEDTPDDRDNQRMALDNTSERQTAFMSALVTEHFVLQTAASATVTEAGARTSLYVFSLSSSLVAMGFVSQFPDTFRLFAAAILPALFVLGLFTTVRLVDTGIENQHCLRGIARIRSYYRTLTPDAARYFSAQSGRWPEAHAAPPLWSGVLVAFLTTAASMIAFINSIVAGTGVTLLANSLFGGAQIRLAVGLGVAAAVALMAAFLAYQRWRYRIGEATAPLEERQEKQIGGDCDGPRPPALTT
jgi:hypothetical protein